MTTSVRDLQIGEMLGISAAWVGPQKATFLSVPQIAALFDRVETAHLALLVARDGASTSSAIEDLTAKADELDRRHDDLNRSLHYLLLAAKYFERGREHGDNAVEATLDRASGALFPQGLRGVLLSYQAEAGNAAQLNALATNEFAGALGNVHITKTITALDIAHAIGSVGAELGAVDQQRTIVMADAKNETITPADVRKRMRDWANVAEVVLAALELASTSSPTIDLLRQPLLEAAKKASERRREKRAKRDESSSDGT